MLGPESFYRTLKMLGGSLWQAPTEAWSHQADNIQQAFVEPPSVHLHTICEPAWAASHSRRGPPSSSSPSIRLKQAEIGRAGNMGDCTTHLCRTHGPTCLPQALGTRAMPLEAFCVHVHCLPELLGTWRQRPPSERRDGHIRLLCSRCRSLQYSTAVAAVARSATCKMAT